MNQKLNARCGVRVDVGTYSHIRWIQLIRAIHITMYGRFLIEHMMHFFHMLILHSEPKYTNKKYYKY